MSARRHRAGALIGPVSSRELFVAGLSIYWSEGSKDKPWKRHGRVKLTNSDPDLLRIYLAWLDLLGVTEDERTYALSIHETADVTAHESWWQRELELMPAQFRKAMLKRHNPAPRRHNTGVGYHGCLVVSVLRSARLYDAIEGWWAGLARGVESATAHRNRVVLPSNRSRVVQLAVTSGFGPEDWGSSPCPGAEEPSLTPWLPKRWWEAVAPVGSGASPLANPRRLRE